MELRAGCSTALLETMGKQISGAPGSPHSPWASAMLSCPRTHHPIGDDQPQGPRAAWEEAQ